jgi:hypothetical protein
MRPFTTAGGRALATLILALCWRADAQNTAGDLTFQIFAKPDNKQFHLLIRVPFQALSGVNFPFGASGELDLARTAAMLPSVARWWIAENIDVYQGSTLLAKPRVIAARASVPSDNAFGSYDLALVHVLGPQPPAETQLFRDQAMFDVLLDYNLPAPGSSLAIRSRLAGLASHATTELEFLPSEGAARRLEFTGDPGLFYLDPSLSQTSRSFATAGFWRVLKGSDYLLFLFCVVLQVTGIRALASFVGAFAAASSVSLLASTYSLAFDTLWFPVLIETLIALSILYMAFENIAGGQLVRRKRILALSLGLIFGFGFALAYQQARQFAGSHPLASVVSFDAGIQFGVLAAATLLAAAVLLLFRWTSGGRVSRRTETIVLSVLAADLAWHRVTDRVERLSQFPFQWPAFDAALLAEGMRWLTVVLIVGGLACVVVALRRRRATDGIRTPSYATDAASSSSPAKPRPDPAS